MQDNSSLGRLRANPDNPRTITPARAAALKKAIRRWGDLSAVILNRRTGQLVTGHQRTEAFKGFDTAKVDITLTYQKPTRTGTIAEGYVTIDGEKFAYREIDVDDKTAKSMSIAANKSAGEWDMSGLTAWLNELNAEGLDMDLTMFDADELMPYLPSLEDDAADGVAGDAPDDDYDADTGEVRDGTTSRTQQVQVHDTASGQVKVVQLFFDAETHKKFLEITDVLKEVYGKDNLSEAVLEAIQRASVSAALP